MKQALLVILKSPNGRDRWEPVHESAVPAWVNTPEVMGLLVAGKMCMDAREGETGSDWFRAATEVELRALQESMERYANAPRVLH